MRLGLKVEQVHLLADLAVIALRRLFEPDEMRVELLLVEPAGAVDARELRIVLVAAPIGAGDAGQLERLRIELAGRGEVGTAAHVEPCVFAAAGAIDGQFLVLGQLGGPFGLEGLAPPRPAIDQLLARPDLANQRLVARDDAAHLLLDDRQVLLGEGSAIGGGREIIIKAVVGRRAEGDLGAGEQVLHSLGEDVGIIVTNELERLLLVAGGDDGEAGILLQRPGEIAHFAVDLRGERRLGEAGADRRRDVRRGRSRRDLAHGAVGKRDRKHVHRVVPVLRAPNARLGA